jgi:hypothetical protein
MKKALVSSIIVVLLGGCGTKTAPDPAGWFIESYDNGVITVQHEGHT